jgi:chromosomal replication initiation ATPase DnaA
VKIIQNVDLQKTHKESAQSDAEKKQLGPEDLLLLVCKEFECGPETILRKGKKRNLVRDLAIYLTREMTGKSGVALGHFFGGISGAGVVVRHDYIAHKIQTDRKLKSSVEGIRSKIINL